MTLLPLSRPADARAPARSDRHGFFTPEFRLIGIERLPGIGSGHLPLLARLRHMAGGGTSDDELGRL
jgi:hypothetical protein